MKVLNVGPSSSMSRAGCRFFITRHQAGALLGYVATTPKPRAETPLWTDKGDPLLAHWQYGLGRAVAFSPIPSVPRHEQ